MWSPLKGFFLRVSRDIRYVFIIWIVSAVRNFKDDYAALRLSFFFFFFKSQVPTLVKYDIR